MYIYERDILTYTAPKKTGNPFSSRLKPVPCLMFTTDWRPRLVSWIQAGWFKQNQPPMKPACTQYEAIILLVEIHIFTYLVVSN